MPQIDLRSDTVTRPTPAMRQAMATAEVGDDVFGEDPTVNRLQQMAADILNKQAALFVASGTMANIVSQMAHCGRGDETILGDQAHVFFYEQGGAAAVGGIHPRTIPNQPDGTLSPADIEAAIRPDNVHFPRTRLILLENTHNRCFGSPLRPSYMDAVESIARRHGLKIHVDGARIFNAAAALGLPAAELAAAADSVSFCLSKGLAAPVGSMVCGSRDFIERARRVRKVLGGGMRQAGVLAAAGILAIEQMVPRLPEDHDNARRLARGLAAIKGLSLDLGRIHTNLVFFDVTGGRRSASDLADRLAAEGVLVLPAGPRRLRAVTHYHIGAEDVERAVAVVRKVMS